MNPGFTNVPKIESFFRDCCFVNGKMMHLSRNDSVVSDPESKGRYYSTGYLAVSM